MAEGRKWIGGVRAGKVADIDVAFLALVEEALAEDRFGCWVVLGPDHPPEFRDRLDQLGVPIVDDPELGARALLIDRNDEASTTP